MGDGFVMIGFGLLVMAIAIFMSSRNWVLGELFIDPGEISKRRTPFLYWIVGSIRTLACLIGLAMTVAGLAMLFQKSV